MPASDQDIVSRILTAERDGAPESVRRVRLRVPVVTVAVYETEVELPSVVTPSELEIIGQELAEAHRHGEFRLDHTHWTPDPATIIEDLGQP